MTVDIEARCAPNTSSRSRVGLSPPSGREEPEPVRPLPITAALRPEGAGDARTGGHGSSTGVGSIEARAGRHTLRPAPGVDARSGPVSSSTTDVNDPASESTTRSRDAFMHPSASVDVSSVNVDKDADATSRIKEMSSPIAERAARSVPPVARPPRPLP